jgi:hypothetical protein
VALETKRSLGEFDAMRDKSFHDHFVSSLDLDAVLNNSTMVVYGSKGTGKSALRRALTEINCERYCATGTIDFNDLSFMQVYSDLVKIQSTTQAEIPMVARSTWLNVLALFAIETVGAELPGQDPLRQRIAAFLEKHRSLQARNTNNRLLAWLEKVFARLEQCVTDADTASLGLTLKQRMEAVAFPGLEELSELLLAVTARCRESGKLALICLDGFDTIVDHHPESRSAIFAGLITALYHNRHDPIYEGAVCFKAFLPMELTEEAHSLLWDADKHPSSFTHRLHWSMSEFHLFVAKRLRPHTKTRGSSFRENWDEIFPSIVHNRVHDLEEDAFNYILRHTLHRPRHVLTQLQRLLDEWDAAYDTTRIDPSFIPAIVAQTNVELAELTVHQLSRRTPNIYSFIYSFRGTPNIHPQADFVQRLRKYFLGSPGTADIELIAKELYDLGLFGIVEQRATERWIVRCRFGSIGPRPRGRTLPWGSTDLIAISPMFQELCGLKESEHGPIIPIV